MMIEFFIPMKLPTVTAQEQKTGVRNSCPMLMLFPSSTRRSMGHETKLKALIKGSTAQKSARIRQCPTPKSTKNSVEPRMTPTAPQQ